MPRLGGRVDGALLNLQAVCKVSGARPEVLAESSPTWASATVEGSRAGLLPSCLNTTHTMYPSANTCVASTHMHTSLEELTSSARGRGPKARKLRWYVGGGRMPMATHTFRTCANRGDPPCNTHACLLVTLLGAAEAPLCRSTRSTADAELASLSMRKERLHADYERRPARRTPVRNGFPAKLLLCPTPAIASASNGASAQSAHGRKHRRLCRRSRPNANATHTHAKPGAHI